MAKIACFANFTEKEFNLFCKILNVNDSDFLKNFSVTGFKEIYLSVSDIHEIINYLIASKHPESLSISKKLLAAIGGTGEIVGGSGKAAEISAEGYFGNSYAQILQILGNCHVLTDGEKKSAEKTVHDVEYEDKMQASKKDSDDQDLGFDPSSHKINKR